MTLYSAGVVPAFAGLCFTRSALCQPCLCGSMQYSFDAVPTFVGRRYTWSASCRPCLCGLVRYSFGAILTFAGWRYTWSAPCQPCLCGLVRYSFGAVPTFAGERCTWSTPPNLWGVGVDRGVQSGVMSLMLMWLRIVVGGVGSQDLPYDSLPPLASGLHRVASRGPGCMVQCDLVIRV